MPPKTLFEGSSYAAGTTGREISSELQYRMPIVFVPGIMGSRLIVGGGVEWEPDEPLKLARDIGFNMRVRERREKMHFRKESAFPENLRHASDGELQRAIPSMPPPESSDGRPGSSIAPPDGYHRAIASRQHQQARQMLVDHARQRFIERGWNEVVWEHYGHFLVEMEAHNVGVPYSPDDPEGRGFRGGDCPVYAVGYDWRASNARSAGRLESRLTEIIERENERGGLSTDQVILVTHSMGGLVARSYLQQFAAHADHHIACVIHLNQPTYGAPVLYRRIKTGAQVEHEATMGLVLDEWDEVVFEGGGTPVQTATMVSAFPSVTELLPGHAFELTPRQKERYGPSWLGWEATLLDSSAEEDTLAYIGREHDLFDTYLEESGKVGLVPPELPATYAAEMRRHVRTAERFQGSIEETFHPDTFWLASEGLKTDHVVRVVHQGISEDLIGFADALSPSELIPGLEDSDPHYPENTNTVVYHHAPEDGDGTVPHFCQVGTGGEAATVQGINHAGAAGAAEVISQVKRWVQQAINQYVEENT